MRIVSIETRIVGGNEEMTSWSRGCLFRYFFCDESERADRPCGGKAHQPWNEDTKILDVDETDEEGYLGGGRERHH